MKQTKNGSKKFSISKIDVRFCQIDLYKKMIRFSIWSTLRSSTCSCGSKLFLSLYLVRHDYEQSRNKLIIENMGLVYSQVSKVIKQQNTNSESFLDLVGVGSIGLIVAVDKFAPDRGNAFSSFAVPYIYGSLQRYYRDKASLIRLPQLTQSHAKRFKQFISRHSELSHNQAINAYAKKETITKEQLVKILEEEKSHYFYSLDNQCDDNTVGITLENSLIVENDETYSIDYKLSWKDTKKYSFLEKIINKGWLSLLTAKTNGSFPKQKDTPKQLSLFSS